MGYLIAVAAAPLLGPVLYRVLHDHPRAVQAVDNFVYVAVPLLVAWQVLPHAWEDRNALAVVAVVAGFIVPNIIERASHAFADQTDNVAIVVGLSGLALHALLEGTALVPGSEPVEAPFALAVILHRVPVSLVIWWLICPRFGGLAAAAGVSSIVVATLAGYGLGAELLGETHGSGFHVYQAFVSGSLVHAVFHQGRHDHDHGDDGGHGQGEQHGARPRDRGHPLDEEDSPRPNHPEQES